MIHNFRILLFLGLLTPCLLHAESSLFKHPMTPNGQLSLETELIYGNSESFKASHFDSREADQPDTDSDTHQHLNTDFALYGLGFRYGLTEKTELFTQVRGMYYTTRIEDTDHTHSTDVSRFSSAWITLSRLFIPEGETPAVIGFIGSAFAENTAIHGVDLIYGKTWMVGVTSYRVVDPVIFAATASYIYYQDRTVDSSTWDPGDSFQIFPSVSFVANSEITISTGFLWTIKQKNVLDGQAQGIHTTRTDLNMAVGYRMSKKFSWHVNLYANISGEDAASIQFTSRYAF